jgi:hypothetical protein
MALTDLAWRQTSNPELTPVHPAHKAQSPASVHGTPKESAVTKEQLADQLNKAITPLIEKFIAQPSPEAADSDEHRSRLEKQKSDAAKVFEEGSAALNAAISALEDEIKGLKIDGRTQQKQNRQLASEALIVVTNSLRLPVKLKNTGRGAGRSASASGSAGGSGRRSRKTNEQMEQEANSVLKALPAASKDFVPKATIADKVGFDPQSALLKLKRDGYAESNGVRGAGGGWRKA